MIKEIIAFTEKQVLHQYLDSLVVVVLYSFVVSNLNVYSYTTRARNKQSNNPLYCCCALCLSTLAWQAILSLSRASQAPS